MYLEDIKMEKNPFKKHNVDENNEVSTETVQDDKIEEKELEDNNEIEASVEADEKNENVKEETQKDSSELEEKFNALNNNYIRLAADFDNYRKRTIQEKEALTTYIQGEVLKKLTGVLDTFDRAKESLKDIEDCKTVKDSYEVAFKQLIEALKKMGLSEIEALNKPFDPNMHEAVTQVPTDEFEPDTVAVVMQKGYKLDDRVLRPALVGVAKPKE